MLAFSYFIIIPIFILYSSIDLYINFAKKILYSNFT